jgi:hypothetical protein
VNYDSVLNNFIVAIGEDKAIIQPWRNYAQSDARRLLALVHEGQSKTNMKPPVGESLTLNDLNNYTVQDVNEFNGCTCATDLRKNCPVHGNVIT